jgi:hypothetical protein
MNDEQDTLAMIWSGRWLPWLPERLQPPAARLVIYASLAMLAILIAPVFDATGGDALDPVNDLVEQYASLLLTSTTALGVQQLGMRIGRSIGAWLFLPSLTALALAVAARGATQATLMGWGRRLFALALFARLAVPAAAWIDAVIAERFLEGSYQEASTAVAATTERIEQAEAAGAEKPWYERYNPVKTVGDRAQQIYESMAGVTESIVNLAIYFTISTIVLPVGTLWLLSKMVGAFFASRGG